MKIFIAQYKCRRVSLRFGARPWEFRCVLCVVCRGVRTNVQTGDKETQFVSTEVQKFAVWIGKGKIQYVLPSVDKVPVLVQQSRPLYRKQDRGLTECESSW